MNGKTYTLFDPQTACLTEQAIYDYLDGKLLPTECHAVEKHLLDCAFCSEAMEGLELVKDRSKVMAPIPLAKGKDGADHSATGGRIVPFYFNTRYAAAAVIILLIGSFAVLHYFSGSFSKNEMASKQEPTEAKEKTDSTKAVVTSEDRTFYSNFEPFPAREIPAKESPEKTKNESVSYDWTPQDNNSVSEGPVSGNSVSTPRTPAEEVTIPMAASPNVRQDDAKADASAVEPPVATLEREQDKDVSQNLTTKTDKKSADKSKSTLINSAEEVPAAKPAESYTTSKGESTRNVTASTPAKTNFETAAPAGNTAKVTVGSGSERLGGNTEEKKDSSVMLALKKAKEKTNENSPILNDQLTQAADKTSEKQKTMVESRKERDGKYSKKIMVSTDSTFSSNSIQTMMVRKDENVGVSKSSDDLSKMQSFKQTSAANKQQASPTTTLNAHGTYTNQAATSTNGFYRNTALEDAMQAYKDKDFAGATEKFGKVLATDPNAVSALFYQGVSYLSLPEPDTKHAIADFDQVLMNEDPSFSEAAKWYKALALIKENNTALARPLLDEMNKGNGVYKAKAGKVLEDIKKPEKR
jgi:hypothetical protein